MAKRDYYEVLGVDRKADAAAVRKAYKRMAMKHHPDRNPGDAGAEERFKELGEAYKVLSDPQKRAAYDRFGHRAFESGGFPFGGGGSGGGGGGMVRTCRAFSATFLRIFSRAAGRVARGIRPGRGG